MRATLLAAAAAFCLFTPAMAQDEDSNCISGQSDMEACSSPNVKDADAKLNQVYRALRDDLSADDKIKLRDAERAWIVYRDKQCAFQTSSSAHSGNYQQQTSVCLAELTNAHLVELKRVMSCRQDATACPWSGSN